MKSSERLDSSNYSEQEAQRNMFNERKEEVIRLVNSFIVSSINVADSSQPTSVCDTGAGGYEHSYRLEQNRQQNTQELDRKLGVLKAMEQKLEEVSTKEDVQSWIYDELRFIGNPEKCDFLLPEERGWGVNWSNVERAVEEAKFSQSMMQLKVGVLRQIEWVFFKKRQKTTSQE